MHNNLPTVSHAFALLIAACASGSPALIEAARNVYARALIVARKGR